MRQTTAEMTMQEALAIAVAAWGPGAIASVCYLGGPVVSVFERDAARVALADHEAREPAWVSERDLPPDTTLGEMQRLQQEAIGRRGAWSDRKAQLEAVAYQHCYRLTQPNRFEAVATRDNHVRARLSHFPPKPTFGQDFDGYSWQEALAKAGLA